MTTITTTALANGNGFRRSGTAQADTGQVDWLAVPGWAKYISVFLNPITFAGTTPVATLGFLCADSVSLDTGHFVKLAEHTDLTGLTTSRVNEIQTLSLTAGIATETFTLTFNTHVSDTVVIPVGGFASVTAAQIKAALITISDWIGKTADITVVKTLNDYAITFTGSLGGLDVGAITVTNKVGAADGSVAETLKGVPGASLLVNIGPGITGIADDVTNSATVASVVNLNSVLPALLGVRLVLDQTTKDERYTYNLSGVFRP